jgi:hypothetical protein
MKKLLQEYIEDEFGYALSLEDIVEFIENNNLYEFYDEHGQIRKQHLSNCINAWFMLDEVWEKYN